MFPFSLQEIMNHEGLLGSNSQEDDDFFLKLLVQKETIDQYRLPQQKFNPKMMELISRYLTYGGLPQAWLAKDEIRRFLAERNSQEFSYKGIQQTLRTSKRTTIDKTIDHLLNHGYLFKKTPYLGKYATTHKTYFASYSWVDPGLVAYYVDADPNDQDKGFSLEAMVHTRLVEYLASMPGERHYLLLQAVQN